MKIQMPVEVLDEECKLCDQLDIQVVGSRDIYADLKIVARDIQIECSHLRLCKRLSRRFMEDNKHE